MLRKASVFLLTASLLLGPVLSGTGCAAGTEAETLSAPSEDRAGEAEGRTETTEEGTAQPERQTETSEGKHDTAPAEESSETGTESYVLPDDPGGQCAVDGWTLSQAIRSVPIVFEGICEDAGTVTEYGTDLEMQVVTVFRGELPEGTAVPVRSLRADPFLAGERYIVFATPYASVFERKDYYLSADAVLHPSSSGVFTDGMADLEGLSFEEVRDRVREAAADVPYAGAPGVNGGYCVSDDLTEIAAFADTIVKVTAESVWLDIAADRTIYTCRVTEVLKGDVSGELRAALFKDSLECGKSYLLYLSHTEGSELYTPAAVNSIFPES